MDAKQKVAKIKAIDNRMSEELDDHALFAAAREYAKRHGAEETLKFVAASVEDVKKAELAF